MAASDRLLYHLSIAIACLRHQYAPRFTPAELPPMRPDAGATIEEILEWVSLLRGPTQREWVRRLGARLGFGNPRVVVEAWLDFLARSVVG
jgi:hypothetical protein